MTKPIIGFAAMQLIEKNFLSLDDTIDKHLSDFKNLKKLSSIESNLNDTTALENKPTVRQLLQHTAGFTYNSCDNFLAKEYEDRSLFHSPYSSLEEEISKISELPLLYEPGLNWHYSISIDVLARVIEVVTKDKISDILNENISNFSLTLFYILNFILITIGLFIVSHIFKNYDNRLLVRSNICLLYTSPSPRDRG